MKNTGTYVGFLLLIVALVLVVAYVGSPHADVAMQSEEYAARQFHFHPDESVPAPPAKILVAVDVSQSMQGFVFPNSFRELLKNTVFALGPSLQDSITYWRFEKGLSQVGGFSELFDPQMFTGAAADFKRAFELRAKDPEAILVLITDLQFNNHQFKITLTQDFQSEIATSHYIKIFSASPQFDGWIFPQFGAGPKFKSNKPRPLYAVVIGDRKYAPFIDVVMKKAMPWEHAITLSNNGPVTMDLLGSNGMIYGPVQSGSRLLQHTAVLKSSDRLDLEVEAYLEAPRFDEWSPINKESIEIESYQRREDDTLFHRSLLPVTVESASLNKGKLNVRFSSKNVSPDEPTLWRIFVRPQTIPTWVHDQSCLPEGDQSIHTVYMKEFIEDVLRPVMQPFTLATAHLHFCKD